MSSGIKLLQLFERARITNGHSPKSFFQVLNGRETKTIPLSEFAENVVEYLGSTGSTAVSLENAQELARILVAGDGGVTAGEIGLRDIVRTLHKHKLLTTVPQLLAEHPNATLFLAKRADFQAYYSEWNSENGVPPLCLVEGALRLPGVDRKPADLQIIYKWLKQKKILVHVANARLLSVSRQIHLFDCPTGTKVVTQGDPGDAFYIVLSGQLEIDINGVVVSTIGAGTSFGEKALENNAPRAATVIAKAPCKLMVLMASEYQSLAATAQNKQKQELVEFLYLRCYAMRHISRAKIFYLTKNVVKQYPKKGQVIIRQGDAASAVYVVMTGTVNISRRVVPPNSQGTAQSIIEDTGVHRQAIQDVHITILEMHPGDIFGDDCLRSVAKGRNVHSYSATAASAGCSVIMINRKEVAEYFAAGRGDTLRSLLEVCRELHTPDDELWQDFLVQTKQQKLLKTLRESAYGESYRVRKLYAQQLVKNREKCEAAGGNVRGGAAAALHPSSRSLSTASLQRFEKLNKSMLAQIDYAQKAVKLTQNKLFKRSDTVIVPGRRASVLTQSKILPLSLTPSHVAV